MKTLFACFAALLFVAANERPAQAQSSVPVDVFYDSLAPYGDWVEVEGYGYCFRPAVTMDDPAWRPYTVGSWVYTDAGWTWDSEEDFGWATYHYGRWFLIGDTWVWTPGDGVWGPAWVSWRVSEEYVGWAPLPPEAEWQPDTGFSVYVDYDYDIGPAYYSFVSVRHLGAPRLRQYIEPWERNVQYINVTENRTRIVHRTTNNYITQIHNDGPDYTLLSRRSEQPIRRLSLTQQESVNFRERSGRLRNTVQNDSFRVIAPRVERVEDRSLRPQSVASRLDRAKVRRGWERYKDEDVRDLRTKFQTAKRETNRDLNRDPNRDVTRSGESGRSMPREGRTADRPDRPSPTDPASATTDRSATSSTDPAMTREGRDSKTGDRPPRALATDAATAKADSDSKKGDRMPKANSSDPETAKADRDSKKGDRVPKAVATDPSTAKGERGTKMEDQPPKALPTDRTAAGSGKSAEDRMRARTGDDSRRPDSTSTQAKSDDKSGKRGGPDREEMRKAIPAGPESDSSKSKGRSSKGSDDSPSERRIQPLTPGPQARPGAGAASERMRGGPQDAPPRSQVGPGASGINRPDDSPPGPSRRMSPSPDSGSTQRRGRDSSPKSRSDIPTIRPSQDSSPKMKPGRSSESSPQQRIRQAPPQPQPQPQAARKAESPKQQAPPQPSPRVQAPQSAPPQAAPAGAAPGGGKPGKGGGGKGDDDKKKKP